MPTPSDNSQPPPELPSRSNGSCPDDARLPSGWRPDQGDANTRGNVTMTEPSASPSDATTTSTTSPATVANAAVATAARESSTEDSVVSDNNTTVSESRSATHSPDIPWAPSGDISFALIDGQSPPAYDTPSEPYDDHDDKPPDATPAADPDPTPMRPQQQRQQNHQRRQSAASSHQRQNSAASNHHHQRQQSASMMMMQNRTDIGAAFESTPFRSTVPATDEIIENEEAEVDIEENEEEDEDDDDDDDDDDVATTDDFDDAPTRGYEYSNFRVTPTSPSSFLRPGSKFHGTQQSERQVYDVQVEIKYVDHRESFLCGYLKIQGLTEDNPTLTTYFEGEMIGSKYSFITDHSDWGASEKVDLSHWGKFSAFRNYKPYVKKGVFPKDLTARDPYIFMRWKEHFLVPDHRVRTINGASFEGFYYICFNMKEGLVSGIYFHSRSEKFQQLELKHVEDRGCFGSIEFR